MSDPTATRIASAALRILETEGPPAVSMRRVAREAGVTAMAIYHHYANREALLRAVTEAEFARLAESYADVAGHSGVRSRLTALTEAYLDYALARPRIFEYVFAAAREDARKFPLDFHARLSPTANILADTVAEGMNTGKLRKEDVWEVTLDLWAFVHGYAALYLGGRFSLPEAEFRTLFQRALRRFLRGYKA